MTNIEPVLADVVKRLLDFLEIGKIARTKANGAIVIEAASRRLVILPAEDGVTITAIPPAIFSDAETFQVVELCFMRKDVVGKPFLDAATKENPGEGLRSLIIAILKATPPKLDVLSEEELFIAARMSFAAAFPEMAHRPPPLRFANPIIPADVRTPIIPADVRTDDARNLGIEYGERSRKLFSDVISFILDVAKPVGWFLDREPFFGENGICISCRPRLMALRETTFEPKSGHERVSERVRLEKIFTKLVAAGKDKGIDPTAALDAIATLGLSTTRTP